MGSEPMSAGLPNLDHVAGTEVFMEVPASGVRPRTPGRTRGTEYPPRKVSHAYFQGPRISQSQWDFEVLTKICLPGVL